jgi:hypothetical protein
MSDMADSHNQPASQPSRNQADNLSAYDLAGTKLKQDLARLKADGVTNICGVFGGTPAVTDLVKSDSSQEKLVKSAPVSMNDNIDQILDELIVPWDTSDLPPNVRITSPSLKLVQAKAAIQAEILKQVRAARIDELENLVKAKQQPGMYWGDIVLDTIQNRLRELQGDNDE